MMLDIMEERKTSVLRVLTDISEAKSLSDGNPARSYKENGDSPSVSLEELRTVQQSKKLLQKKNQLHPLFANHPYRCASMYGVRGLNSRPNQKIKDISQRIVSAKLLQIKELKNQLTLTQHQLNEVANENRFLKTLQKRQEVALRKYEGHEARLPQLIQSHTEEVRILTSKLKQMKYTNSKLMEKLKSTEQQLNNLQEQHNHLVELSRNNNLGEREDLANRVEELTHTVRDQNNTIQLLNRKVDLERKNYKHELGMERSKRNEIERKLALAMQTIENLKDQIEAKEKCMNAIVPSRYVRTSHGLGQVNASKPARMSHSHSQIPRTPRSQSNFSGYKNVVHQNQTLRRSSTDHTGDETDIPESHNGSKVSLIMRNNSNTTLPKIKPQIINKNPRNHYKMPSKRTVKEKSYVNETPDYSSSFASEEISYKEVRKSSENDSDKLPESKSNSVLISRKNSCGSRKLSVDSGVINRSESGKITQRTNDSRESSSKTRRNSIAVCPAAYEIPSEMGQYQQKDSHNAKMESHKSIRDELKELEEKLLKGSTFFDKSQNRKSLEDEELAKGLIDTPRNLFEVGNNDESHTEFDEVNWTEIHNKMKAESKAAEAKLEEYYNNLEKSELSFEETENYIALEEEQKARLLKALKQIDKEAQGVSSDSSPEDITPSPTRRPSRRKSDVCRYSVSKSIDNLHKGLPVYENVKVAVTEKMKREEQEYLSDMENGRKNKSDFMKELFGNYSEQSNKFAAGKRQSEERERLVEINRTLD